MTGIILAGGRSSRMGFNKAFLSIGGRRIIDGILSIYNSIFQDIIIVTNTPESYEYLGVKLVRDIFPDKGPLGGLYTGLLESKDAYCFVTACDMPFINEGLIRYITGCNGYDIVVPVVNGNFEPLFALYSKNCLDVFKKQLLQGELKIINAFSKVNVKEIHTDELNMFDIGLLSLININTPKDLKNALKLTEKIYEHI